MTGADVQTMVAVVAQMAVPVVVRMVVATTVAMMQMETKRRTTKDLEMMKKEMRKVKMKGTENEDEQNVPSKCVFSCHVISLLSIMILCNMECSMDGCLLISCSQC